MVEAPKARSFDTEIEVVDAGERRKSAVQRQPRGEMPKRHQPWHPSQDARDGDTCGAGVQSQVGQGV